MKKIVIALLSAFLWLEGFGQNQDPNSPVFDYNYSDSTAVPADSGDATEEAQAEGTFAETTKPYIRIILIIDSSTNLITYSGVVEQEESGSDSLYIRAKRFAERTFGKDKSMYEVDKRNQKLVLNASIPAFAYINKYNKRPIGKYEFKLTVLVKEGRYRYIISNLVHEAQKPSSGGKPTRNYFEYYYTTTQNVVASDKLLRFADKDIRDTIEKLQLAMREPILVDEDEW